MRCIITAGRKPAAHEDLLLRVLVPRFPLSRARKAHGMISLNDTPREMDPNGHLQINDHSRNSVESRPSFAMRGATAVPIDTLSTITPARLSALMLEERAYKLEAQL